jgi:endonuclease YncB( thermonuclease family)
MTRPIFFACCAAAFLAGVAIGALMGGAHGQERFVCMVASIQDGDSLTCGSGHRVRLAGIDAPELNQPHGRTARMALVFLAGEPLACAAASRDSHGRYVAICATSTQPDVGATLVRGGHAWDYVAYSRGRYAEQQELAKLERLGLWRDPAPVEPWIWRQGRMKR